MEFSLISLTATSSITLILLLLYRRRKASSGRRLRLPPGPPGWPVFGNLFDLAGPSPHRSTAELRRSHGDVVWLRLGAIDTVVILSAAAAGELFKRHDMSFCDRTVTETSRALNYHEGSLALAPHGGPFWRATRRLVTRRLSGSTRVRTKCVDDMIRWTEAEARAGRPVRVGRVAFLMSFNLIGNLVLSRDVAGPESEIGSEFFAAMEGVMRWGGSANVADVVTWLRRWDPQGLRRKMERDLGKAVAIVSKFVEERVRGNDSEKVANDSEKMGNDKDFLDVLLGFQGNGKDELDKFSDHELNIFVLEIFLAGSETTSSTIEWALTELLRNPDVMLKAKAELNEQIGPKRNLQESDIENLPYLNAIIKETLRLHSPIPFLVPRRAKADTNFMGHLVPEGTQVFVNAWAIGRDPDVWGPEPLAFKPERFMMTCTGPSTSTSSVDYRGQHFGLIPFGAGRRMCAGVPLAHRVLHLALGSLLHHFDWKLCEGVNPENIDMRDRLGITIRKFEPLVAMAKKLPVME